MEMLCISISIMLYGWHLLHLFNGILCDNSLFWTQAKRIGESTYHNSAHFLVVAEKNQVFQNLKRITELFWGGMHGKMTTWTVNCFLNILIHAEIHLSRICNFIAKYFLALFILLLIFHSFTQHYNDSHIHMCINKLLSLLILS